MKTRTQQVQRRIVAGALVTVLAVVHGGTSGVPSAFAQQANPSVAKPARPKSVPALTRGATSGDELKAADRKKARDAYAAGQQKYAAGDFAGALASFRLADSIKQTPQAARYIGLCFDGLGRYEEAVAAYDRFLINVPPKMTKEGDEIRGRLETIRRLPATVRIETRPSGASVLVDGKAHAQPTPTELQLAPGRHTLRFSAPGRSDQEKTLDVPFAAKLDMTVDLPVRELPPPAAAPVGAPSPPQKPSAPARPRESERPNRLPAYITGGLAVAAAGVGTYFGLKTLSTQSDYNGNPTQQRADDGENQALIADMAFGLALTLGVTSAVLFFSKGSSGSSAASAPARSPSTVSVTASPVVTPHGAGAGAQVRF